MSEKWIRVLKAIKECEIRDCNIVFIKDIREKLEIDQWTLYNILSKMVKRGLVERVNKGAYKITENGLRVLNEISITK